MGFFTTSELSKKAKKKVSVDSLEPDCLKCLLYKQCNSPKMQYSGEGRKKILIVGEFPTLSEDEYGIQFVGEAGEILKKELRQHGISLTKDCWKINAVNCKPPEGRVPTHKEIKCCYPMVERTIKELKPKVVLAMGSLAITSLFGEDFSNRTVDRWRANIIPDEKLGCFIVPMFHPWQLLRNERDKNLHSVFARDLKFIKRALKLEYTEQKNYEEYVTVLKDFNKVKTLLKRIIKRKSKISFDYETTGLKPYRKGHKIVTIGIAVSPTKAFAFPFNYKTFWTKEEYKELKRLWKKIIKDKEIEKISHNSKFEDAWSKILIGSRIKNNYWDSMISQKVMDNRRSSTGLKFQTFVRYGVRPYDQAIKSFLQSKNGEFNTVEKAPFKELLVYNGLDCIFAWMLYEDQKKYLSRMKNMKKANDFFMRGIRTMGTIQFGGINVDEDYYEKANKDLTKRISTLEKDLTTGREARKFKKKFGREINITSNPDLGKLFFEVLGKPPVFTGKGNYKTDRATMESLNLPFVDNLVKMKKLEKARGTYLAQFARESYQGVIHPFFDLHIPISYRSSSNSPNFQNIPKRDKEIKSLIRKGIVPSRNSVICEADFSGAEVITSVAYHQDENFYNYLIDPTTDMHRDLASELFLLPNNMLERKDYSDKQKRIVKDIRFFAKNNWTFAQFYGDWFGSCGPNLWENVVEANLKLPNKISVKDHLEEQGIYELGEIDPIDGPTPGSFLEHCKEVEHRMWNERFPAYTQWKKDIVEFYQEYGYVETYFGFRFQGYMDRKQCANFPIQGTSFHLLLYTLIQVDKFIKKHKLRTKLIGQIHDSVIADVHKEELNFYLKGVHDIVSGLQNKFSWLTVPMEIEAEISQLKEDGGNFAEMKEINPLNPIIW